MSDVMGRGAMLLNSNMRKEPMGSYFGLSASVGGWMFVMTRNRLPYI